MLYMASVPLCSCDSFAGPRDLSDLLWFCDRQHHGRGDMWAASFASFPFKYLWLSVISRLAARQKSTMLDATQFSPLQEDNNQLSLLFLVDQCHGT